MWCRQRTHGGSHGKDGLLDRLPSRQRMGDDEDDRNDEGNGDDETIER